MCEACEGTGFKLWLRDGKPAFARCFVCDGERTVHWGFMGAQPRPPFMPLYVISRHNTIIRKRADHE